MPKRRYLLAAVALLILFVSLTFLGSHAWRQYHLRAAQQALARLDLDSARSHLKKSSFSTRSDAFTLLLLARVARQHGDYQEAEEYLAELRQQAGDTAAGDLEWQLLGVEQGMLPGLEKDLNALISSDHPEKDEITVAVSRGYLRGQQTVNCIRTVYWLLNSQPDHPVGLLLRGLALQNQKFTRRALQDFEQALAVAPWHDETRLRYAELLARLGRSADATREFEILRQRRPTHPPVLLGLARCRFEASELTAARQALEELLIQHPWHPEGLRELGRLALRQGEPEPAADSLRLALLAAPWQRETLNLLVLALRQAGRSEEADEASLRLAEFEERDRWAGQVFLAQKAAPRDPGRLQDAARYCLDSGLAEAGFRWLYSALDSDPDYIPSHAWLAEHFERQGQPLRGAWHRDQATRLASQPSPVR